MGKNDGKNILYIEDNPDIAESVKLILEVLGHNVTTAMTGEKGLQLLKKNSFDLVIFDIMLPDMSGLSVFEEARKHHLEKKYICKYVFLSILNLSNNKKKELDGKGVSDYISKPFRKKDLIERISKALEKS